MNRFGTKLLFLLLIFAPWLALAGGEEVVVIYNSRMPESKAVAEHYAKVREVPTKQIYGLNLSTNEEISRTEFRETLQVPLAKKLESSRLWKFGIVELPATNGAPAQEVTRIISTKIRYAVLCYGVPLKIRNDPELNEDSAEKVQSELRRNDAAVDSELVWLPLSRTKFPLTGTFPNWLYAATNPAAFNPTNGVLMVARLDGPSAEIASGLVDKAVQAERDGLWGRAYFDARDMDTNSTYYVGDYWILSAAKIAQRLGFETVIDDRPATFPLSFPMSQIAIYCGWYDGSVSGPFTRPKVEFMPGSFAYHLHSYSASTVRSATENWCGPLLAKGATCTMGCVYEPFLSGTPNVAVFLEALAGGYTFGESAWTSQSVLSWQTTVIGDPLYCPFKTSLPQLHAELARTQNPLDEWAYLRLANLALVRGTRLAEVVSLLDNLDLTAHSAVLTEKLANLFEAQGKPSSAILTYEKALNLNPSPEQRIRLRLTLGEKLQTLGRNSEAMEDYAKLIAESPDYPGRSDIENTLARLRQKLTGTNTPAGH